MGGSNDPSVTHLSNNDDDDDDDDDNGTVSILHCSQNAPRLCGRQREQKINARRVAPRQNQQKATDRKILILSTNVFRAFTLYSFITAD